MWFFLQIKKETAYFNATNSTDQTERAFEWKLWFTCLIAEVDSWNNPGIDFFFFKCVFHRLFLGLFSSFLFTRKFIFHLSCRCCYWELVGFRKVYADFHGHWLVVHLEKKKKRHIPKGFPHDRLSRVSCLPPHKHLTSANLSTGETGVKWVCFRLRCFLINYNLTVGLWCFYCSEASNSGFIKGKL